MCALSPSTSLAICCLFVQLPAQLVITHCLVEAADTADAANGSHSSPALPVVELLISGSQSVSDYSDFSIILRSSPARAIKLPPQPRLQLTNASPSPLLPLSGLLSHLSSALFVLVTTTSTQFPSPPPVEKVTFRFTFFTLYLDSLKAFCCLLLLSSTER